MRPAPQWAGGWPSAWHRPSGRQDRSASGSCGWAEAGSRGGGPLGPSLFHLKMKLVASGVPGTRQGLGEDWGGDKVWPRRATESHQLLWKGPLWSSMGRCYPGNHSSGRRGRGNPGSPLTLPQSAMQARAPRAHLRVGWERSWSAPRWRMTVAPPSAAVSLWAGGVGWGWGWGLPGRRSASLLLPGPLLCTFNGTFYGVRALRPGSWGRRRVGSGFGTSSEDPCAPLTTTVGGSRP